MLLQTNSYIVPRDKRAEHARILRRFRQALLRLGCDHFEVFEQVGANWNGADSTGRFVQIMRFRDRKHQLDVQAAERNDPTTQALLAEFCDLINFPYQQQQGLFAVGYYNSFLRMPMQTPAAPPALSEAPPLPEQPDSAESEQASGPSGVLSMSQTPEESTAGAPTISSDDPGSENPPDGVDLNSEIETAVSDESVESADQDMFATLPETDLPEGDLQEADLRETDLAEPSDAIQASDAVSKEADTNGESDMDADTETQNRASSSNS
jgi:hypothetical protein